MNKHLKILALATLGMFGLAAAPAHAFDVTGLRNTPGSDAPGTLQANGFRFVGTYNDFDNEWKMWFNRGTGECVGYTQKGRQVRRAKPFNTDRCRSADRGFDDRRDRDDRGGGFDNGGGYDHGGYDRHDDRDGDVPGWMVGYFRGYNRSYGSDVSLNISPDGTVVAIVNGNRTYGEFRHGKLRLGMFKFYIDRDPDGFTTRQVGDESNVVRYRRR
jgi:hypothetical protein